MNKIICKNVPEALLNRKTAKIHFRKFGSPKRLAFRRASRIITVEYGEEEAVEKALEYGNIFDNETFSILRDSTSSKEQPRIKKIKRKDVMNVSDEVMAEIDAMEASMTGSLPLFLSNDTPKKGLKRRGAVDKEKVIPKKNRSVALFKNDEYQELLEIINQRAITIEEKYKVLDARDKLLRILQKRNGANNGSTKGTCPDMCPEKERLLRVIQHQVSSFEQNPFNKEMDPNLAVKQYSRSSADQESPLPHELRPVNSLMGTMSYLIHDVIPLGDQSNVGTGEWYHFVWDRTRAIRKDITQQELCCFQTVQMMEQCARFHIHCSARLVAEDPSVFDQKINTENLTKCLQTLKYMYHDLRLQNIICPNEAEFRAYIILLNLNDGNFMAEVQRLPSEIQESKQVKEAMRFHSVLNAMNFVRFFRMVKETTYLNACILMRYFMQIRCHTMNIMIKSYTRHATVTYPIATLAVNLGFESVDEMIQYLLSCKLEVNRTAMGVILDKYSYVPPSQTSLNRSISLVESKRGDLTLDCVVFGGPIPPYVPHSVTSSFDEEGYLLTKLHYMQNLNETVDENQLETCKIEEVCEEMACESEDPVLQEQREEDELLSLVQGLPPLQEELTVPEDDANPIASTSELHKASDFGCKQTKGFTFQHPKLPEDDASTSENKDNKEPQDLTSRSEEHAATWRAAFDKSYRELCRNGHSSNSMANNDTWWSESMAFNGTTSNSVVEVTNTGENENASFTRVVPPPQNERVPLAITPSTSHDESKQESAANQEGRQVAASVLAGIINKIVKLEEKKRELINKRKAMNAYIKWRSYVFKKKQQRDLNGWCNSFDITGNLRRIAHEYSLQNDVSAVTPSCSPPSPNVPLLYRPKTIKADLEQCADLLTERYRRLGVKKLNDVAPSIYWKCIVSQPGLSSESSEPEIIKQKLDNYIPWTNPHSAMIKQVCRKDSIVRFCISSDVGYGNLTNDANGVIFIAESMDAELSKRITEKFVNTGIHVCMPIVVILAEDYESDHQLKGLVKQDIISEFRVFRNYKRHGLVKLVVKGLKYLAKATTGPPPIVVDYLTSILFKKYLISETWQKVISSTQSNYAFRRCFCNPNIVFNLYNEGLQRLKQVLLDESCFEYGRFPLEFRQFEEFIDLPSDYKHLPELHHVRQFRDSIEKLFDHEMSLRPFSFWPPRDEGELETILWEFACNNCKGDPFKFYARLLFRIRGLLHDDIRQLGNLMWTEVFDLIFVEKYSCYQKTFGNLMPIVVYHSATLEDFLSMKWISVTNPIIKAALNYEMEPDTSSNDNVAISEIDEAIAKANRFLQYDRDYNVIVDYTGFHESVSDLETSMLVTQNITSNFGDYFQRSMEDN